MPNHGLSDEMLVQMRASELARRAARRQVILNHAALDDHAPDEIEAKAIEILREQHARHMELVAPPRGYWKRLWDAIWGRD